MRITTLLLLAACAGGNDTSDSDSDLTNPRNPHGEGPLSVHAGPEDGLGSADDFVLLAKTSITNVTGSSIAGGDVGLSPAAGSFLTGFALVQDSSGTWATSASVESPGRLYAADFAPPTPAELTVAIGDMEAAYEDAAGRSPPDELDLFSGDLGGLTLAPGLYTWGSSVTIPGDLTFDGGPDDVWILQISGDLDQSAATAVVLAGGAQPGNIYWQLAGQATVHADAHLAGIVLSKTAITLQTQASLDGRAFAQSMIALDDNAVTAP